MPVKSNFASGDVLTASDTNTYLTNGGLVYITEATATSGGTLSINNCFTSTYTSYCLVATFITTTASAFELNIRLRASGVDTSTGYYGGITRVDIAAGTSNVAAMNNTAQFQTGCIAANAGRAHCVLQISAPQLAQYTSISCQSTDSRSASGYGGVNASGTLSNTTQYDGLTFGAGAFGTGVISNLQVKIYGYRQA